jgi:hypothetical protein
MARYPGVCEMALIIAGRPALSKADSVVEYGYLTAGAPSAILGSVARARRGVPLAVVGVRAVGLHHVDLAILRTRR